MLPFSSGLSAVICVEKAQLGGAFKLGRPEEANLAGDEHGWRGDRGRAIGRRLPPRSVTPHQWRCWSIVNFRCWRCSAEQRELLQQRESGARLFPEQQHQHQEPPANNPALELRRTQLCLARPRLFRGRLPELPALAQDQPLLDQQRHK